jgi:hypothetical protein
LIMGYLPDTPACRGKGPMINGGGSAGVVRITMFGSGPAFVPPPTARRGARYAYQ